MINRIGGDRGRITTITIVAVIAVTVTAIAGAALYFILSNNTSDDSSEEMQGSGIGTEYIYRSGDGDEIRSKIIGDSPDKYVFRLDGPGLDKVDVILNKFEGIVSWAGDPLGPSNGKTVSWEIQTEDGKVQLDVEKTDGIHNITGIVWNGEKYVISIPDSTVTKPSAYAGTKFGEKFVYDIERKYTLVTDRYVSTVTASGTFTAVREAVASDVDGTKYYVFSSELNLKYTLPSRSEGMPVDLGEFSDIHKVTIFTAPGAVPELIGVYLPGDTGRENTTINGPDGAASVAKHTYILSEEAVGVNAHASYETYIGTSDGMLYRSKTYGSADTDIPDFTMEYEFSVVYSHHYR